jgi:hypothetical protein
MWILLAERCRSREAARVREIMRRLCTWCENGYEPSLVASDREDAGGGTSESGQGTRGRGHESRGNA